MNEKTVRQSLIEAGKKLSKTSASPSLDAEVILSHVLKKPREHILANPDRQLNKLLANNFHLFIRQRARGVPVAYITGTKDFYGRSFMVSTAVLIPRPETEKLVDTALAYIKKRSDRLRVLDLGTGSGCIAITLSKELQNKKLDICASDISSSALKVARKNAKLLGAKVRFLKSDLMEKIPEKFDLVVANLPYVPTAEYNKNKKQLRFEPRLAIDGKRQGIVLYRRLLSNLSSHLNSGGALVAEIDPSQKITLSKYAAKYFPHAKVKIMKDLAHRQRYMLITKIV